MRIVFMGTPDFAEKSLEKLFEQGHEIIAVVTNPDKPKGRGMKMIASPVKQFAISKNLKVYQPLKVKGNEEFIDEMKELKPDLFCVVAYGKILPKELLDIPKYGSINVHGSLLPKYRGSAPIQWAIINGEKVTGITTMFMDVGMDTGDMILKSEVEIGDDETTGELWDRLSILGADLLVETVDKIEKASEEVKEEEDVLAKIKDLVHAKKQGDDFTVAPMLNKEIAKIDWDKSAKEIHNLVRGLNPIMGAYTILNDKKVKIWKTKVVDSIDIQKEVKNGEIAKITKNELVLKTGNGYLSVLEIQPESKNKMAVKDYINGSGLLKS